MCDSCCALTGDHTWFAKSSDRPVDEAQVVEAHERRPPGGTVRAQYVALPDTGAAAVLGSRPTWLWGFEMGLNEHGVAIGNERVYTMLDDRAAEPDHLIGMDLVRLALERAGGRPDLARVAAVATRKAALFERRLPEIDFFPGARELVVDLAREVPLAIASGALRGEIEAVLAAAGLRECFGAVVGADDVAHTKPHPEPYLAALRRLAERSPGLEPSRCLALEDSPPGLLSARAAGLFTLGVAHTYPAAKLGGVAHAVVASLAGLRPGDLRGLLPGS